MRYFMTALAVLALTACADVRMNRSQNGLDAAFRVKDAGSIALCPSFNGYEPLPAVQDSNTWKLSLPPVKEFRYFLMKDGEIYLPDCPMKEYDDFGGQLCVYQED